MGPKRYAKLALRLENKLPTTVETTLSFLEDVYVKEYAEVHRIWTLPSMSEEVWKNYITLFNDTDFYEITILKAARKALKGRYIGFFKAKKTKAGK